MKLERKNIYLYFGGWFTSKLISNLSITIFNHKFLSFTSTNIKLSSQKGITVA